MRPIRCNDDQVGPALGLVDDFEFATVSESLGTGDRVILFTDDVFEAVSPSDEEFGPERLANALAARITEPLGPWLDGLLADLTQFTRGHFGDDLCVVAAELRN